MKHRSTWKIISSLISWTSLALVLGGATPVAKLTVDVDKPGITVSPVLYGVFFEEINRAGDGGLYAEMLQNRSFEDANAQVVWRNENGRQVGTRREDFTVPLGWSLIKGEGAEVKMSLDSSLPLNQNNPTSLKIEVVKPGIRAGVANDGFKGVAQIPQGQPQVWMPAFERAMRESTSGVAVQQGKSYDFSMYARGQDLTGPVTVSIEKQDGTVLASAAVPGIGAAWKQYKVTLTANATESNGRLVVSAASPGTLWLDVVSLFPQDTFKNRPNGMRADLAQLLADMHPGFVRFPGGCFVEGERIAEAFRWKKTIGDVAERPGHWCIWGYNSSDGLGYHEYLQLCEDIHAEPLFVINVGMAHRDVVPMDQMPEFVQDAMDAIEYANGPADSKWGSLRAKAGHPAPFNLKYMEIGNENGGPRYAERYALFHDAIKAKYPDMNLVACVWGNPPIPTNRPLDLIDEHYYLTPEAFMGMTGKYDTYDRKGPHIYVGEYAVTNPKSYGTLRGAIGEAAYMTGLERNSDIVAMGSYAPLFSNLPWNRWTPNAIVFDSAQSYGIPSWHVQSMFASNRADVVLPIKVDSPLQPLPHGGQIGLGTWVTQSEYKDIKVTGADGKVLYESDFSKGMNGWKPLSGKWEVVDGALRQTSADPDSRIIFGDPSWGDYTITLKARKLGGNEGFLILFNLQSERDKRWWNLGGWGNKEHGLEPAFSAAHVPGKIDTDRWYDIRLESMGGNIRAYLDGKLVNELKDTTLTAVYAMAGRKNDSGDVILKIVNASPAPVNAEIDLRGIKGVDPAGSAIVLTSAQADDENSFREPQKVAPKTEAITNASTNFTRSLPGNSVTILRLKPAK